MKYNIQPYRAIIPSPSKPHQSTQFHTKNQKAETYGKYQNQIGLEEQLQTEDLNGASAFPFGGLTRLTTASNSSGTPRPVFPESYKTGSRQEYPTFHLRDKRVLVP